MSSKSMQTFCPFLVVMVLVWISTVVLGGRSNNLTDVEIEEHLKRLNKPAIKTILSDDGDIIDCVDIYMQPAFDHPLLKNHTIEMKPSFIPKAISKKNKSPEFRARQTWQKSGGCPEGTIPIRRIQKSDLLRAGSLGNFGVKALFDDCNVEVARAELHRGGPYIGAEASIAVWDLYVEPWEYSLSSVTMFNVRDSFIETGWAVSPVLFGDSRPRVFVNWLGKEGGGFVLLYLINYNGCRMLIQNTESNEGCFNLACPGFVQTANSFVLGGPIYPTSELNGTQYVVTATIYNDDVQQKWWATFNDEPIGYWPWSILRRLDLMPRVNWGGTVCNTRPRGQHTNTQMGSGHFPLYGYRMASHMRDIAVMTATHSGFVEPQPLRYSSPLPICYHVTRSDVPGNISSGASINYGGPGGPNCDRRRGRK